MAGLESLGRWLLIGGVIVAILGALIWLLARAFPGLNQVPGTIRLQTGNVTCLFPILASILLSIILTIVLNLIARYLNK